ncbi:MAG: trypsin-like peptidase domain-containing protein, partial [Phycisphaerales bacterium]
MGVGTVSCYSPFAIRHSNSLATSVLLWLVLVPGAAAAGVPSDIVVQAETRRVEMMERTLPSVVCVFDSLQRAGGSGVLIDQEGYGLSNYHVVAGLLGSRKGLGGLADGVLYELEVLGVDVTGDVAMFRLIAPKPGFIFPHARLGDSDAVQMGDTAIAMGNPFSLSQDYTPTVSLGIVTGVHRYQEGVRGNLVYTDCIQVDAPINPGNSGGPLFNEAGEVIGINGRISVNTRGRFNVGFAYAISSNQIKRFIPALRAGLLARHGTWQAIVEDTDGAGVVFSRVGESGPAYQAGVRVGDSLLSLDGVRITSANQVMSMLGTYPADWPVLLQIRREAEPREVIVRLDAVNPKMRNPFAVDEDVNLRQVKRVLGAFRRAVLGGDAARRPDSWKWTVARHYHAGADGSARSPERFEASQTGDGPIRMQQRYVDGSPGRRIEYDDRVATER